MNLHAMNVVVSMLHQSVSLSQQHAINVGKHHSNTEKTTLASCF